MSYQDLVREWVDKPVGVSLLKDNYDVGVTVLLAFARWLDSNATQHSVQSDETLRACEHKNMLPSEPHGHLYCPDCGFRR